MKNVISDEQVYYYKNDVQREIIIQRLREKGCIIEFEDNTYCRLSARAWHEVINEGLKACGYGEGKRINSVEVERCSGQCFK